VSNIFGKQSGGSVGAVIPVIISHWETDGISLQRNTQQKGENLGAVSKNEVVQSIGGLRYCG
jgi:hypothetical protein